MAVTAPRVWVDGGIVGVESVSIPVMGHAPQRGSLVFDVGSFHGTAEGTALFRVREHVARFLKSARIVGLSFDYDEDALVRAAVDVVAACGKSEGLVRWSAFFAAAEPDLVPRSDAARVAVAALFLQDPPRQSPIRVAVFDDARKASPEALSPEAKAAAAYLGPMIARRRAIAAGADDVVLLDRDGNVAEAPIANVFAVSGGVLRTPPLGSILPGITRDTVLEIARAENIPIREAPLTPDAFASSDEAFLTATSLPIAPIATINAATLPRAPGPITSRIAALLSSAQHGRSPDRASWLTHVA